MKNYPFISVIFPTFNGWEDTKKCIKSIYEMDYPRSFLEIIIVDNASRDQTVKEIKKLKFQNLKLIINNDNLGFGKAVNLGVKAARGEYILITNNDVVFDPRCLKELLKVISQNQKIAVASGKLIRKNYNQICVRGFRLNPYLAYSQFDTSNLDKEKDCDWATGSLFLVKKDIFLKLGGFDEKYFFYFEDVDFCLRAKRSGFKIRYAPLAIAYHDISRSIYREGIKKMIFLSFSSRWRCVFKNASPLEILTSSLFLLTVAPVYQSIFARRNVFGQMLAGLLYNLKRND